MFSLGIVTSWIGALPPTATNAWKTVRAGLVDVRFISIDTCLELLCLPCAVAPIAWVAHAGYGF
jgi:hypothetical protein